jgi:hypothetical protein
MSAVMMIRLSRRAISNNSLSEVSGKQQISDPTIRMSFPRAFGGNPGILRTWTPARSTRG